MTDQAKLKTILEWLSEKKAENIKVYDVHKTSSYTDLIVVCEGTADVHNKAIAAHLIDMAKEHKLGVISKEGVENGQWVLIDTGDVIVHIFLCLRSGNTTSLTTSSTKSKATTSKRERIMIKEIPALTSMQPWTS